MKTRAVVFAASEHVLVEELDVPPPGKNEIQVRTTYSTISAGTESWRLRGLFTWAPTQFPSVPGYQRSGVVTAVGPEVTGWEVGDRVATLTGVFSTPGVNRQLGAHIEIGNTPLELAFHLPSSIDDVDASNLVVAQVGYNAASRAQCKPGDWVVVYGDGLVGQSAAQAARARDARVVLVGHRELRLELARRFSADATVNSAAGDLLAAVREITGSKTVPVVLDSVQTPNSQKQYVDLLEPASGQIVYNGFTPDDHWASMALLQQRELTTHFVSGVRRDRLEATLALMASGRMKSRPLTTHLVPFAEAPKMFQLVLQKSEPFLGITLDWRSA